MIALTLLALHAPVAAAVPAPLAFGLPFLGPIARSQLARTATIVGGEMALGDAVEQRIEHRGDRAAGWDRSRSLTMGLTGLTITGPLAHALFMRLEQIAPGTAARAVAAKVGMNAAFMPAMIAATLSTAWAIEGRSLAEIKASLEEQLLPAVGAGLMFWPAVNCLIFAAVAPPMRPAVSSGFGGVWGTVLSARANA